MESSGHTANQSVLYCPICCTKMVCFTDYWYCYSCHYNSGTTNQTHNLPEPPKQT